MGDRYPVFSENPKPEVDYEDLRITENSVGNKIASFGVSYTAKDPVTPSLVTPMLDVHSTFDITENLEKGYLIVHAVFKGDVFPSTEAFISDQSGNKLFLGARKEIGDVRDLYGDNNKDLFEVVMVIKFDKKGNFTGVIQRGKLFNLTEWNRRVESQF